MERRPQPLRITDGATYRHDVSMYDQDTKGNTTPWDLTDVAATAELRAAKHTDPLLAKFEMTTNPNPPQLSLALASTDTAGLYDLIDNVYPLSERGRPGDTPQQARMDIRLGWPDGTVDYLFAAHVLIYKVVTWP